MNHLIVAGGRDFQDADMAHNEILSMCNDLGGFDNVYIIEGGATGADRMGRIFAELYDLPYETFHADWNKHGKAAGHIRNGEMAEVGTHLLAFWDGKSRGTKNMIDTATKNGLEVRVINYATV